MFAIVMLLILTVMQTLVNGLALDIDRHMLVDAVYHVQ